MLAYSLVLPRRPELGDPQPHQPRGVHRVRKSCVILRSMVTARYLIQQAASLAVSEARSTQQTTNFAETKVHFEQQLINFPTLSARFEQQQTVSVHAPVDHHQPEGPRVIRHQVVYTLQARAMACAPSLLKRRLQLTQSLHLAVITRF